MTWSRRNIDGIWKPNVQRCCIIQTVNPGSPLSPLAPLVPGPPWNKNQTKAVKTVYLQNAHLQIQEICFHNKMQHQSASCTIGIHFKNTNCNSMSVIWANCKLNWSVHGGQCCSVLQAVPLSKVLYSTVSAHHNISLEQYISGQFPLHDGDVHICESLVHLGYIFYMCLLKYVSLESKGVIQVREFRFKSKNNFLLFL